MPNQKVMRPATNPLAANRRRRWAQGQSRARRRYRESRRAEAPSSIADRRASSIAKRMRSPRCRRATTSRATSSSSAMRDPKGGPGMREMLSTTAALYGQGLSDQIALITDGRFSGATRGLLHRSCRTGSRRGRTDRAAARWRHHRHRCRQGHDRRRAVGCGTRGTQTKSVEAEEIVVRLGRALALRAQCRPGALRCAHHTRRGGRSDLLRRRVKCAAAVNTAAAPHRTTLRL